MMKKLITILTLITLSSCGKNEPNLPVATIHTKSEVNSDYKTTLTMYGNDYQLDEQNTYISLDFTHSDEKITVTNTGEGEIITWATGDVKEDDVIYLDEGESHIFYTEIK